jgi:hypothetical protein
MKRRVVVGGGRDGSSFRDGEWAIGCDEDDETLLLRQRAVLEEDDDGEETVTTHAEDSRRLRLPRTRRKIRFKQFIIVDITLNVILTRVNVLLADALEKLLYVDGTNTHPPLFF